VNKEGNTNGALIILLALGMLLLLLGAIAFVIVAARFMFTGG